MPLDTEAIGLTELAWTPCHRLIASRYPTVGLFDDIASPEDLDAVFAIEALTNPRVRQQLGALSLMTIADRVSGPGASLIMAAFLHLNPTGSRFSDGSYGVYYAADSLHTAIAEVSHHRGIFLSRTAEPEIDVDLRWIKADLCAAVHDIRSATLAPSQMAELAAVYDPDDYSAGQALGRQLRTGASNAITYDSVRAAGGQCIAVFLPRLLTHARPAGHLSLHWDGQRITHWYHKGAPHPVAQPRHR